MKISKAVLDFIEFKVNDKIEFYKNVALQLADISIFQELDVPLATINQIVNDFEVAILASKDGAHSAISERNDKEKIADDLFRVLVIYVNKVANGDETIIIKSGFHVSKQPTPFQKAEIAVNNGQHSGDVIVVLKAVLGAVAYKVQYKKVNPVGEINEWIEVDIMTLSTCKIANLIPGSTYQFRYASISSAGTSDFSEPVTKIVI